MKLTSIAKALLFITAFSSCNTQTKIDSHENVKQQVKGVEREKIIPVANIDELETEVNNGGLNQYFVNSSGQNCYETLRLLKKTDKANTAAILEEAISLINPRKIRETEFVEKLRQNKVEELYDEKISQKLEVLDEKFYKYPDGSLK
jgi:hypothetical protein